MRINKSVLCSHSDRAEKGTQPRIMPRLRAAHFLLDPRPATERSQRNRFSPCPIKLNASNGSIVSDNSKLLSGQSSQDQLVSNGRHDDDANLLQSSFHLFIILLSGFLSFIFLIVSELPFPYLFLYYTDVCSIRHHSHQNSENERTCP